MAGPESSYHSPAECCSNPMHAAYTPYTPGAHALLLPTCVIMDAAHPAVETMAKVVEFGCFLLDLGAAPRLSPSVTCMHLPVKPRRLVK